MLSRPTCVEDVTEGATEHQWRAAHDALQLACSDLHNAQHTISVLLALPRVIVAHQRASEGHGTDKHPHEDLNVVSGAAQFICTKSA